MSKLLGIVLLCAAAPFAHGGCQPADCDPHVEHRLTITQGVYGQATSHNDVGVNPIECCEGSSIAVFSVQPNGEEPEEGATPITSVTSGEQGFYEVLLPPQIYWVCTCLPHRCQIVQVKPGRLTRADYFYAVGGGWFLPSGFAR
jgi:hypothetical protein